MALPIEMSDLFTVKQLTTDDYEQAKTMYLDNALNNDTNPIDSIELVKYREVVYPRERNTFLNRTRNRKDYISGFWRQDRKNRSFKNIYKLQSSNNPLYEICAADSLLIDPSLFPLDARDSFFSKLIGKSSPSTYAIGYAGSTLTSGSYDPISGSTASGANSGISEGAGILQNSVSQFAFFDKLGESAPSTMQGSRYYII